MRVATNGHRPVGALSVAEINELSRRRRPWWRQVRWGMLAGYGAFGFVSYAVGHACKLHDWTALLAELIGVTALGIVLAVERR